MKGYGREFLKNFIGSKTSIYLGVGPCAYANITSSLIENISITPMKRVDNARVGTSVNIAIRLFIIFWAIFYKFFLLRRDKKWF